MKKYLLLLPLLALAAPAAAQHTEIAGRAGLGLMRFGGESAQAASQINYTDYNGFHSGYTNSPYGNKVGAGISVGARVQHVGRRNGLLTFDLGYDWVHSRVNIDGLNYYNGASNSLLPATGTTLLKTDNLTAFLGVGHRFELRTVSLDVLAGPEYAYVFGFREKGSGTYDGAATWSSDRVRRSTSLSDARLRADVTAWYHRVGVNASYSHGFVNYQGGLVGASPEVYSRTLRLGLVYRLK